MSRSLGVALGIVALIVIVVVVLATGGVDRGTGAGDQTADVQVDAGADPPRDVTAADIAEATVTTDGDEVVFVAEMATEIPERIPGGSLEFRWDVIEDGDDTWIVSASVGGRPVAALTAPDSGYGSSTIDNTMPGTVEVAGTTLTVSFDRSQVDGFPQTFEWRLETTLDANRADPQSGIARDRAPDSGNGKVEG
ncbi:MAG TPA: hypothetical protein VG408_01830 [Actinomycetota bacterium]|nr:hypothetical protein [Actinomycetota bacterium]